MTGTGDSQHATGEQLGGTKLMRPAEPPTRVATPRRRLRWSDLIAAAGSIVVGVFGAACYYSDTLRPLAHNYIIWVLLVVLVSARQPALRAAVRGGAGLLLSVVAFYYGKQLIYGILYPGPGYPYRVAFHELALWGTLGLVGGAGLGLLASGIGRTGWLSAAISATTAALMLVDAYQWSTDHAAGLPEVAAMIGTVVVLAIGDRSGRQLLRTTWLLIPAVLLASAVIAAPDQIRTILGQ